MASGENRSPSMEEESKIQEIKESLEEFEETTVS